MKTRFFAAALSAAFVLAAGVPAGAQGTGGSPGHMGKNKGAMMMAAPHQVTITLNALNGSGESGKAVLKDTAAHGVSVMIALTALPPPCRNPLTSTREPARSSTPNRSFR